MNTTVFLLLLLVFERASATEYYVATTGSDAENLGTKSSPWASLSHALGSVEAGDTVFIRGGRYHEAVTNDNVRGSDAAPITIRSFPGESVIFDGTVPLAGAWQHHAGEVHVTDVDQRIWQLFVDDQLMIPARWPNARFDDKTIFSRESWAHADAKLDVPGYMVSIDETHNLSALDFSVAGAIVLANVNSFITYTRTVTHHTAGSNKFNYTQGKKMVPKHHYYFLEAKLELLDQDSEWHIDNATQKVYLWAPGGGKPKGDIRGRVQQYVIDVRTWADVVIDGITFFATTMRLDMSDRIVLQNCDFPFGGASRRALGIEAEPSSTLFFKSNAGGVIVRNISVTYSDSQAIYVGGKSKSTIENCLFEHFDWTATENVGSPASVGLRAEMLIRRNTIRLAGGSETIGSNTPLEATLNDISVTGFAQSDGGMIQVMIGGQNGTRIRNNWLHDSPKSGFRFDAPIPPIRWGHNGSAFNNVIWRCGGGMPKGDNHHIYGNTLFDNSNVDLILLDDSAEGYFSNGNSSVINNAADSISGHRKKQLPYQSFSETNFNGALDTWATVQAMLQSVDDFDFRPRTTSTLVNNGTDVADPLYRQTVVGPRADIGAYELGDDEYFIPGRQEWKASFPIPPVGRPISTDAPQVMWRQAYRADTEVVLLGNSPAALRPLHTVTGGVNNVYRPGALPGGTYYWRIDSTVNGLDIAGDVWEFFVEAPGPAPPLATPAPAAEPTPAPVTQRPVTPAPVTQGPVTPAPATLAPVTQGPSTAAPVTPPPATPAPATPAPVTQGPVTPAPATPATLTPSTPAPASPTPVPPAPVTGVPSTPAPAAVPTVLPTSSPPTSPFTDQPSQLSGGAVAGIVVGVCVGAASVVVGILFFRRHRRQSAYVVNLVSELETWTELQETARSSTVQSASLRSPSVRPESIVDRLLDGKREF